MRIVPFLIAALLALLAPGAGSIAQQSPPAFPLRFDFNDSTQRWANQSPIDASSVSEWTPTCGRAGGGIHMKGTGAEPDQMRVWRKLIPNPPAGRELRIRAWARGAGVESVVAVAVQAHAPRSLYLADFNSTQLDHPLKGDFDWTELKTTLNIPRGCANVQVLLMLVGNGEVWFDDVEIDLGGEVALVVPGLFLVRSEFSVCTTDASRTEGTLLIPLPLVHADQAPLTFKLTVDPPGRMESISYEPRGATGNRLARVRLKGLTLTEETKVSWESVVLAAPTSFERVPARAPLPAKWDESVAPWLASTRSVESDAPAIRAMAKELKGDSNDEMEIIKATIERARAIYAAQEGASTEFDAVQALTKRGTSTSGANLIAALLRACSIPARLVSVCPAWAGPVRAHYLVEAYVPEYGWYTIEPTALRAPWPGHQQIALAIVSPADEDASAARASGPGGTPYLSVIEYDPRDAPIRTRGLLGAPASGCDHECAPLRNFPEDTSESVWKQLLATAAHRWEHSLDKDRCPPTEPGAGWFKDAADATPAAVLDRLAKD